MTLNDFFKENNKLAVAFSGGVDSAYLLYEAKKCDSDVMAYYVKSQFQPEFELEDAKRFAEEYEIPLKIIEVDVLSNVIIANNPKNRCFYCKKEIFSAILLEARNDGYDVVVDGTNASDDISDRPGMKALVDLSVRSPLRECGLTKDEIRKKSKEAGLFTWDKPAYACLATRIRTEEVITAKKLEITEKAEGFLSNLGFHDFRVRMIGEDAKLQIKKEQNELFFKNIDTINNEFKKYYKSVLFDLEGR